MPFVYQVEEGYGNSPPDPSAIHRLIHPHVRCHLDPERRPRRIGAFELPEMAPGSSVEVKTQGGDHGGDPPRGGVQKQKKPMTRRIGSRAAGVISFL